MTESDLKGESGSYKIISPVFRSSNKMYYRAWYN